MKKIGVIGESPYDTKPLCKIWNKQFKSKGQFQLVLQNLTGNNLESMGKMERLLKAELTLSKFDAFIFVRDLDAPRSNVQAMKKRLEWFNKLSKIAGKSIFLLNVQEIEAVYFSDLISFNKIYDTKLNYSGNPEMIDCPKEKLISATRRGRKKFRESDNEMLLPTLDFKEIEKRCEFYKQFISDINGLFR